MKDNIKTPCKECPFRKTSFRGWLGNNTAQQTHDYVLGEADFACHMTRHKQDKNMSRCKGSQLFLLHHCKSPRINMPLRNALNKTREEVRNGIHKLQEYLGFDFFKHHNL